MFLRSWSSEARAWVDMADFPVGPVCMVSSEVAWAMESSCT